LHLNAYWTSGYIGGYATREVALILANLQFSSKHMVYHSQRAQLGRDVCFTPEIYVIGSM
jgi:hypothetical protein